MYKFSLGHSEESDCGLNAEGNMELILQIFLLLRITVIRCQLNNGKNGFVIYFDQCYGCLYWEAVLVHLNCFNIIP